MKNKGKKIKTYSQIGQDTWLLSYLNNKRNGFFVEAGAGDGIRLSNTYLLEQDYGWTGICVEPYQPLYQELKKNRSCKCVYGLLDGSVAEQVYCSGKEPINPQNPQGYLGGIVSEDTDNKIITNDSIKMKTVTLENVLDKNNAPKYIDYLSLDVEGAETRILKNFPYDKYKFQVMHIERPSESLCELLIKNNYDIVERSMWDVYFAMKNHKG
jgi:FkbM family methyltransferase